MDKDLEKQVKEPLHLETLSFANREEAISFEDMKKVAELPFLKTIDLRNCTFAEREDLQKLLGLGLKDAKNLREIVLDPAFIQSEDENLLAVFIYLNKDRNENDRIYLSSGKDELEPVIKDLIKDFNGRVDRFFSKKIEPEKEKPAQPQPQQEPIQISRMEFEEHKEPAKASPQQQTAVKTKTYWEKFKDWWSK